MDKNINIVEVKKMSEVIEKGKLAKEASYKLNSVTTADKNDALLLIAKQIIEDQEQILSANEQDLQAGKAAGLTDAVLDRILLDKERMQGMAEAVELLTELDDPI